MAINDDHAEMPLAAKSALGERYNQFLVIWNRAALSRTGGRQVS